MVLGLSTLFFSSFAIHQNNMKSIEMGIRKKERKNEKNERKNVNKRKNQATANRKIRMKRKKNVFSVKTITSNDSIAENGRFI